MFKMNKKGFTLVELLVVLAILGLLAGIGIPQYMKTLENSRVATDKANIGRVQSAVDAFLAETNYWKIGGTGAITTAQKIGDPNSPPVSFASPDEPVSILTKQPVQLPEYWAGNLPVLNSKTAKDTSGAAWYMDVNGRVYIGTASTKVVTP